MVLGRERPPCGARLRPRGAGRAPRARTGPSPPRAPPRRRAGRGGRSCRPRRRPTRPSTRRPDHRPRERERVGGDPRAGRVPVGADDGVARGEPLGRAPPPAGTGARAGRPPAPAPAARARRPTARPRGRGARGDLRAHRRERVEKDVPALVGPEEPAEEKDGRVDRHAEPRARGGAVRDHRARLGRVRHDRDGASGRSPRSRAALRAFCDDEPVRAPQDGARQRVRERARLVVEDVVAEEERRTVEGDAARRARAEGEDVRREIRGPPGETTREGFLRVKESGQPARTRRVEAVERGRVAGLRSRGPPIPPLFPF